MNMQNNASCKKLHVQNGREGRGGGVFFMPAIDPKNPGIDQEQECARMEVNLGADRAEPRAKPHERRLRKILRVRGNFK